MIELFHSDYSTCSQKVRLALAEKELDFVGHVINFRKGDHLTPEYLAMNPNGVVPTMRHDGGVVTDSSVIIEYIDEVFPAPALTPADPLKRAEMRSWLRFIEEVPTVAIRYPSFQKVFVQHFSHMSGEDFDEAARKRPLRTKFYREMGLDGFDPDVYQESLDRLRRTCERMEGALADQGPWLVGEMYTLADICVTPTFDRMEDLGMSSIWGDLSAVTDWWQRIKQRRNYGTAYYPGSRVTEREDQPAVREV